MLLLISTATPALADACGDLIAKIESEAGAELGPRSSDYANFTAAEGVTLTLSCGGNYPSSVGAQFRGEEPPEAFYETFGRAGHAVTGIAADLLRDAARRARADAARLRHSRIEVGGALVICSFTRSDKGPLTMCAVIEQADRS